MQSNRLLVAAATVLGAAVAVTLHAQQSGGSTSAPHVSHGGQTPAGAMTSHHAHGSPAVAITFTELEQTAQRLAAARQATEKYRDVRVAEAAGYRAIGPNVDGMGTHYVRETAPQRFSVTEPPILLYERDAGAPGGLRLVGVSYLLVAPIDADGQPVDPPFPKALASWHKHNNICVLPDNSASVDLTEPRCTARGGRFTAETSWMVHAWIWKDSPAGVFSPTNPLVR
jgi:hypothetical protein